MCDNPICDSKEAITLSWRIKYKLCRKCRSKYIATACTRCESLILYNKVIDGNTPLNCHMPSGYSRICNKCLEEEINAQQRSSSGWHKFRKSGRMR